MSKHQIARAAVTSWLSLYLVAVVGVGAANAEDSGWAVVVTPQVWLSHISNNGFSATAPTYLLSIDPNLFKVGSQSTASIDPQWGGQLALQKAPWTFALAAQYVTFETRNDVNATRDLVALNIYPVAKEQTLAQEFVNTDRLDLDLILSHFFPDVVLDRLDVALGLGFKFIYASASRNFTNIVPGAPTPVQQSAAPGFLYYKCSDNLTNCRGFQRVSVDDFVYGATLPLGLNFYPASSPKFTVPFNINPFLGAETRDDHGVVYDVSPSGCAVSGGPCAAKRLDGTTLAYGVTADAGVRYTFSNGVSVYGAFRVQAIEGHQAYLAWGPMVNVTVVFGR